MQKSTSLTSWDNLRFFLAIAHAGSFSAASRTLRVEQSTISRRLGRLETSLGVRLFDRTPEGAKLTTAGEELLRDAQAVEAHINAIEDRAAGLETQVEGLVRVTMTETLATLMLFPNLSEFLARHPRLRVEVRTGLRLDDMLRRDADIAVRNVRPPHSDIVSRHLMQLELGCFATRDYLESKGWPCDPATLDWVAPEPRNPPYKAVIRATVGATPRVLVDGLGGQLEVVRAGFGAAIMSRYEGDRFDLVDLDIALPLPALDLYLVTHRALRYVPRVRVVMDWLVELARSV